MSDVNISHFVVDSTVPVTRLVADGLLKCDEATGRKLSETFGWPYENGHARVPAADVSWVREALASEKE